MTKRFTTSSRNLIILILGTLIAIGPFSIDMYLPGFGNVADDFGVDISKVGLTLTSYLIGIALGQLAYGPLMDRFGRRRPLIGGLILFTVTALLCAFSWNLNILIAARFFMALGGCAGMVASKAIVRDLFEKKQVADVLSTLMLIMGVAPIIAPTVGGIVIGAFDWEAVFYILAVFAILMLLLITFVLPESAAPNRSTSLRPKNIVLEYLSILRNREFFIFAITRGFTMGCLLSYVSSAPFIFIEFFELSEQQFGWVFGSNALGLILGSQINRLALKRFSLLQITVTTCVALSVLTACGLGISFLNLISFWVVYPFLFMMLFLIGFQNPNVTALSLDPFTKQAGSASALIGSIGMIFGSVASILVAQLVTESVKPLLYILFGSALCSLALVLYYLNRRKTYALQTS
ncbi:MAG: multidrug effflux MFS transporter [Bacteroidota bacterium]|uniref:multidrug effflux MFS transporter n=1 Tax=Leeuwenhoekiella palythoae TaxID=573501 RepID=UPI000C3DF833|nr:multidrug effflux MFS transporter [Leeuwenhoekiella palythoae]MBH12924.1 Bcr/CflA family drug resistance efflux transporter [Leeuwenhoekiella sp.]MEC7784686.1 multidrug effflux MFS transporter [Bacteroidota bacterium]MEC8883023.1 multidrug effflux MFS transporter [Bacteroidota bacterium]MEE3146820.1 multidrug effflux MFS transporter [Bacteroidota bacterium]MEE3245063.1 multidrug effflux MFS transporter [Bacteroidota bacterium]|tara:strand:+ start:536 stop:1753 length:1218 start_codon:yes stop_codon:yes gene_type:complete